MLQVHYARDAWRTNGLCIRIRLVVLSNFHVQSIFIRVLDYFILIFKVLNHFLNYFNSKIIIKLLGVPSPVYTKMYPGADMWAKGTQLTSKSWTGQQGWGLLVILCFLT